MIVNQYQLPSRISDAISRLRHSSQYHIKMHDSNQSGLVGEVISATGHASPSSQNSNYHFTLDLRFHSSEAIKLQ